MMLAACRCAGSYSCIGKLLLARGTDANWQGRRGRPWEAGIATSAGKESNLPAGSNIGKQQMLTAALTGRMV